MPPDNLQSLVGCSMKSLLLAAHCVTLQRLSGEVDVTTGLVTHGRLAVAGAEVAAGLFLNTIPIRLDDKPATWLDVVEHVARFERASHRYRRYPLQAMQSDAGRPLFTTAFNLVNYHLFAELAGTAGVELLEFEAHGADKLRALGDHRDGSADRPAFTSGERRPGSAGSDGRHANTRIRSFGCWRQSYDRPSAPSILPPMSWQLRDVTQLVSEQAAATPDASALVTDYDQLDVCRIGLRRGANRGRDCWPAACRRERG